jgi:Tfp pilus assembly protein PilF
LLDQLTHPVAAPVAALAPTLPATTGSTLPAQTATVTSTQRTFTPRMKRNYDETTFRQAELEMHNLEEMELASKGPERHAQSHVDRGNGMLANGLVADAETEFREAITLNPKLANAHVGLAKVALSKNDFTTANAEVDHALAIDSSNDDAQSLKKEINSKLPQKAGDGYLR